MPRRLPFKKGNYYHLYNRGVDHRMICHCQADYHRLISTIQHYAEEEKVPLYAWCILSNHYHLCGAQESEIPLSRMMQRIFSSYTRYFNDKYTRRGPLFESRFVSKWITNKQHYQNVVSYIEQNAVRHKIVTDAQEWPYSSLSIRLVPDHIPTELTMEEEILELEQLCRPEKKRLLPER